VFGYDRHGNESPSHVLRGTAARPHAELYHARMKFITIHEEMSCETLLSHEDFIRELELDRELHESLEEIWSEALDEEISRQG